MAPPEFTEITVPSMISLAAFISANRSHILIDVDIFSFIGAAFVLRSILISMFLLCTH